MLYKRHINYITFFYLFQFRFFKIIVDLFRKYAKNIVEIHQNISYNKIKLITNDQNRKFNKKEN